MAALLNGALMVYSVLHTFPPLLLCILVRHVTLLNIFLWFIHTWEGIFARCAALKSLLCKHTPSWKPLHSLLFDS
ncbi:hypothetical protein B0H17DRAFT_1097129 [Mycena rosella]|uniref:Uncharacterized protein n=1 Tax=Mycena rosella TaxID=1033263 RepID=A0AAD7CQK5_MYCRO|nr:hypothetical protein B0H17DRAFT_1097129 [Mycena rosella]